MSRLVHVTSAGPIMPFVRDDQNGKAILKSYTASGNKEEAFDKVELKKVPPSKPAVADFVV